MSTVYQITQAPIVAHAFNKDRTRLAIAASSQLHIYANNSGDWVLEQALKGHDKPITSLDWAPNTDRIVTCAQDRNAYVWSRADGTWKPTLVLLRLNRAATHVRWSPDERKFAVGSGSRCVSVCYFEQENDWWVSKHLKKPIRSTVLGVSWHPNNVLLAAASSDMKARVFSAYIKGLDEKPPASKWGERLPFNTLCAEYYNGHGGWVHSAVFSPSGAQLAWVGHDSSLAVGDSESGKVWLVKTRFLPFVCCLWLNETAIVCAGHDFQPFVFMFENGEWRFVSKLDQGGQTAKKVSSGGTLAGNAALAKFKQMDSQAQDIGSANTGAEVTVHQNTIVEISPFETVGQSVRKFSTCGLDGKVVVWDLSALSLPAALASLKI